MTDPQLDLFGNLDPAYPVDSQIPVEYRRLPDNFWDRTWVLELIDTKGKT